jgi:hypothetical protein
MAKGPDRPFALEPEVRGPVFGHRNSARGQKIGRQRRQIEARIGRNALFLGPREGDQLEQQPFERGHRMADVGQGHGPARALRAIAFEHVEVDPHDSQRRAHLVRGIGGELAQRSTARSVRASRALNDPASSSASRGASSASFRRNWGGGSRRAVSICPVSEANGRKPQVIAP